MERRINNLLRRPQVLIHLPNLPQFVRRNELFGIFKTGRRRKQRSGLATRLAKERNFVALSPKNV